MCTDITIHMMHILQQYSKGIVTGANTNRWKNHVLANSRLHTILFLLTYSYPHNNIKILTRIILSILTNSFYRKKTLNIIVSFQRFENQDRHTIHLHMLLWLENFASVNSNHKRASIPTNHRYLGYLVRLIWFFTTTNTNYWQKA